MVAKLGSFLIDITTSVQDGNVKKLSKSLGGLTSQAVKFGSILAGVVTGSGYGLARIIRSTVDDTAELGRLAKDLGTSTNFLETFTRAFEAMGAGGDEAISTIRSLKKEIELWKFGKGNIEAFGILQMDPQQFGNDVGKNFDLIRRRFNSLTAGERLMFADQIGMGDNVIRMLRLTDKEYKEQLDTAKKIPLATQKQIDSSEKYKRKLTEVDQTWTAFKRNIVMEATPALTKFSDEMLKMFNDPEFQKGIVDAISELVKVLPDLIRLLPAFAEAIIKLSDFLVPDATGNKKIDKSFGARFFSRTADIISGGPILDAMTGSNYKERMGMMKNMRKTPQVKILQKTGLRQATKKEISQQDLLDHEEKYGSEVTRIINAKPSLGNSNTSNTYTINVPVQNAGGNLDVNKMQQFSNIIRNTLDRRNQMTSQNFKSGSIQ